MSRASSRTYCAGRSAATRTSGSIPRERSALRYAVHWEDSSAGWRPCFDPKADLPPAENLQGDDEADRAPSQHDREWGAERHHAGAVDHHGPQRIEDFPLEIGRAHV